MPSNRDEGREGGFAAKNMQLFERDKLEREETDTQSAEIDELAKSLFSVATKCTEL
jgi:hypothetical protein